MKLVHAAPKHELEHCPSPCHNGKLYTKNIEYNSLLHVSAFISPSLQRDAANLNLCSCMIENINYYTTRHNRPQANTKRPAQSV